MRFLGAETRVSFISQRETEGRDAFPNRFLREKCW